MGEINIIEERRAVENFEKWETLDDYFRHCIDTNQLQNKKIAFLLGMSEAAFSARVNRSNAENAPKFGLNDLWRYMNVCKDYRPLRYLEWCEKKWKREEYGDRTKLKEAVNKFESCLAELKKMLEALDEGK